MSIPQTPSIPAPEAEQSILPTRKATRLNQMVDVSRAPAVVGDSLVYQDTGDWAPQDVTPGAGDIIEMMFADGAVSTRALADGSVTDPKIGDRTIDDSAATPPSSDTGTLLVSLNRLARMIKAITGKTGWKIFPAISLETLNIHHTRHSTGGADAIAPADIGASSTAHTHANATTSVAGFESTADKTKLDSVDTGAAALSTSGTITSISGSAIQAAALGNGITAAPYNHQHGTPGLATPTVSGFMSSTDKTKLNTVATNAAALTTGTIPITPTSNSGAIGTGTDAAAEDHRHALPSGANILANLLSVDGTGSNLDADKLDGLHASQITSVVGSATFERQASAARVLTTTPTVVTGTSAGAPQDGTYLFLLQCDFLCSNAADIGVAFTVQLYVNGGGTGIMANYTGGTASDRATVSAFGYYFMTTGNTYELRVSKASGASTTSKAEVSTTKVVGMLIS